MDKIIFPQEDDFRLFIKIIKEGDYIIKAFLPPINNDWYIQISECVSYTETIHHYEKCSLVDASARLLYKVAKRHEFGDGNKRSAVMAVHLFCLLNDHSILDPFILKQQAKRIAKTKGRKNENLIKGRVALVLKEIIKEI